MNITTESNCIIEIATELTGVSREDLMSKRRDIEPCRARWAIMRILRERGFPLESIGKVFKRTHGAVMHALKQEDGLCNEIYEALKQRQNPNTGN